MHRQGSRYLTCQLLLGAKAVRLQTLRPRDLFNELFFLAFHIVFVRKDSCKCECCSILGWSDLPLIYFFKRSSIFLLTSSWQAGAGFGVWSDVLGTFLFMFEWGIWSSGFSDFSLCFRRHYIKGMRAQLVQSFSKHFHKHFRTCCSVSWAMYLHRVLPAVCRIGRIATLCEVWKASRILHLLRVLLKHGWLSPVIFEVLPSWMASIVLMQSQFSKHLSSALHWMDQSIGHSVRVLVGALDL